MSMVFVRSIFYLLVLLLPTQLGLHFFLPFSTLDGVRVDYLTPTAYLTDILVLLVVGGVVWERVKKPGEVARFFKNFQMNSSFVFVFLILVYLFATGAYSQNVGASLYSFLKVIEYLLLGWAILYIRPSVKIILSLLSIGVLYESLIAFGQFFLQHSIGMGLWFAGERTFYASTPGIATFSMGGVQYLRPYATFPHPNVLGGFLALVLSAHVWIFLEHGKKLSKNLTFLFGVSLIVGTVTLLLTVSRAAWMVYGLGIFLAFVVKKKDTIPHHILRGIFWLLGLSFLASLAVPLFLPNILTVGGTHWIERGILARATIRMIALYPLFGVGLNNFIGTLPAFLTSAASFSLFQPVHNMYLLVLSETGIVGFLLSGIALIAILKKSIRAPGIVPYLLTLLLFLGLFDHYLLTLQQGQLLFTLIASLSFLKKA